MTTSLERLLLRGNLLEEAIGSFASSHSYTRFKLVKWIRIASSGPKPIKQARSACWGSSSLPEQGRPGVYDTRQGSELECWILLHSHGAFLVLYSLSKNIHSLRSMIVKICSEGPFPSKDHHEGIRSLGLFFACRKIGVSPFGNLSTSYPPIMVELSTIVTRRKGGHPLSRESNTFEEHAYH